jgi:hypothetical protein
VPERGYFVRVKESDNGTPSALGTSGIRRRSRDAPPCGLSWAASSFLSPMGGRTLRRETVEHENSTPGAIVAPGGRRHFFLIQKLLAFSKKNASYLNTPTALRLHSEGSPHPQRVGLR